MILKTGNYATSFKIYLKKYFKIFFKTKNVFLFPPFSQITKARRISSLWWYMMMGLESYLFLQSSHCVPQICALLNGEMMAATE